LVRIDGKERTDAKFKAAECFNKLNLTNQEKALLIIFLLTDQRQEGMNYFSLIFFTFKLNLKVSFHQIEIYKKKRKMFRGLAKDQLDPRVLQKSFALRFRFESEGRTLLGPVRQSIIFLSMIKSLKIGTFILIFIFSNVKMMDQFKEMRFVFFDGFV
jgi:hypothetical protein